MLHVKYENSRLYGLREDFFKISFYNSYKGPVPLADGNKTYAKRTQRMSKISGIVPSVFIRSRNEQKWRKFAKTERKRTDVGSM